LGSLFAAAFTQSRNPMALLDERRCHVEVNGAYVSLLGYPPGELRGHPVYEFIVGGPKATAVEWQRMIRGKPFTGQSEMRCADGHAVAVQWSRHAGAGPGRWLVLFVALSTSLRGRAPRRTHHGPLNRVPLTAGARDTP
jgi:PAS domain S-box-containing protein